MAVRVAKRLAGPERTASAAVPAMGFRPGRYFADDGARRLPVVVIVATGMGEGDAETLAREFEHAQMMTGSFRPLFVIDNADFTPFRSRGFVVERVMRADELRVANPHDSHGEYLFSRLRSITRDYGAVSVVPIPPGAADSLKGTMARLVGALAPA
jgi:hypothetical protein